jgi:ferric-dicitrate binding protein FerR (iron transport regulator)
MRVLRVLPILLVFAAGTHAAAEVHYAFEKATGKVVLQQGAAKTAVAAGVTAAGGDHVLTGWRGRTTIAVAAKASRFDVYPSSHVQLASTEPGVLVVVERGRLKAWFDAITGEDERLVQTPGATLAVRGTRYGVEVLRDGTAYLTVFEGRVQVRPLDRRFAPVDVTAGEICEMHREREARVHRLRHGADEESWDRRGTQRPEDSMRRGRGGDDGSPGRRAPGVGGSRGGGGKKGTDD